MAFTNTITSSKIIGNGLVMEKGTWNAASVTSGVITPNTVWVANGLITGRVYKIITVGTTDFTLIGASANTIDVIFTATGAGSGTGLVQEIDKLDSNTKVKSILYASFTSDGSNAVYPACDQYPNQVKITVTSSDTGTYTLIGKGV